MRLHNRCRAIICERYLSAVVCRGHKTYFSILLNCTRAFFTGAATAYFGQIRLTKGARERASVSGVVAWRSRFDIDGTHTHTNTHIARFCIVDKLWQTQPTKRMSRKSTSTWSCAVCAVAHTHNTQHTNIILTNNRIMRPAYSRLGCSRNTAAICAQTSGTCTIAQRRLATVWRRRRRRSLASRG